MHLYISTTSQTYINHWTRSCYTMGLDAQFGIRCNGHQLGIHGALGRIDKSLDAFLQASGALSSGHRELSCLMSSAASLFDQYAELLEKLQAIAFNVRIEDIEILRVICHAFFSSDTDFAQEQEELQDGVGVKHVYEKITVSATAYGEYNGYTSCEIAPCRYGGRIGGEFRQSYVMLMFGKQKKGSVFNSSFDLVKYLCEVFLVPGIDKDALISSLDSIYTKAEASAKKKLAENARQKDLDAQALIRSLGRDVKGLDEFRPFVEALKTLRSGSFQSMTNFSFMEQVYSALRAEIE
jgi:hypothetical protein